MPLFSIIIPTYNAAKTFKDCLSSVIAQSFTDFEILVMDGGSTDDTCGIARSFQDNRIRIYSEKDKGVYDAMNKGIDKAEGDWLYFLGSDDELYQMDVLEQIHNWVSTGDYDFVYGNAFFKYRKYKHYGEFDRLRITQDKNICHQAIFYKRALFQRLGKYNLMFPIWSDWDFNVRCFSTPDIKIKYIDMVVSLYDDNNGLSARMVSDSELIPYLPLRRKDEALIARFKSTSSAFKAGMFLLHPFHFFKSKLKQLLK